MSKKVEARPYTRYLKLFGIKRAPYKQWLIIRDFTSDLFKHKVPFV